jgi:hypothetical protein
MANPNSEPSRPRSPPLRHELSPFQSEPHVAAEYEEFERFRAQRRRFATVDLAEDKVRAVAAARMDPCHDHPEPGLILNYAYLWHDEHRAGLEEGRKDRPNVIVLSITRESDDAIIVTVLPITHAAPDDPKGGD